MGNVYVFSFLDVCCKLELHNIDTAKKLCSGMTQ